MPLSLQAKLLRFLEQKRLERVGSTESIEVDVRILAATNQRLPQLIKDNRFRDDLSGRRACFHHFRPHDKAGNQRPQNPIVTAIRFRYRLSQSYTFNIRYHPVGEAMHQDQAGGQPG